MMSNPNKKPFRTANQQIEDGFALLDQQARNRSRVVSEVAKDMANFLHNAADYEMDRETFDAIKEWHDQLEAVVE